MGEVENVLEEGGFSEFGEFTSGGVCVVEDECGVALGDEVVRREVQVRGGGCIFLL